jgi:hypothetical protein
MDRQNDDPNETRWRQGQNNQAPRRGQKFFPDDRIWHISIPAASKKKDSASTS